jgi:hypothetical protein
MKVRATTAIAPIAIRKIPVDVTSGSYQASFVTRERNSIVAKGNLSEFLMLFPPGDPPHHDVPYGPTIPTSPSHPMTVTGADGAPLTSYYARPDRDEPAGGVLVVDENRGLVTHIRDVVRRVATAGFSAVAVDLLSRQGGADRLRDPAEYVAVLSKQDAEATRTTATVQIADAAPV